MIPLTSFKMLILAALDLFGITFFNTCSYMLVQMEIFSQFIFNLSFKIMNAVLRRKYHKGDV